MRDAVKGRGTSSGQLMTGAGRQGQDMTAGGDIIRMLADSRRPLVCYTRAWSGQ
jgi:hypothetical protein